MRIVLLANNKVGFEVTKFLSDANENIVGLFLHPEDQQIYGNEIAFASKLDNSKIHVVGREWDEARLNTLNQMKPDLILVVFWNYLLPKEVFQLPPKGAINFHLSFLPYNKGKKPNVWPIIDGTPAGVSLHYINDGIDAGDILARRSVDVDITDTAKTLYEKLINIFPQMFIEEWVKIKNGTISPFANEGGTLHFDKDFSKLDEISLDDHSTVRELINHLRARTFEPYPGAYFMHNDEKIYLRIQITREDS